MIYLIRSMAISARLMSAITLPTALTGQVSIALYEQNAMYPPVVISPFTQSTAPKTVTHNICKPEMRSPVDQNADSHIISLTHRPV